MGIHGTHWGADCPGAAAGRRISRAAPPFPRALGRFLGLFPAPASQRLGKVAWWVVRVFPTAARRAVAAAGGKFLGFPGGETHPMRWRRGMARAPQLTQAAVLCLGPHDTPRERETLAYAHFTAESTEAPEALCVGGGTPIPLGAHALGPRGLQQGRRGRPQALGPGLPVRRQSMGVHCILSGLCPLDAPSAPPTAVASF